jgi:hypothetical protein
LFIVLGVVGGGGGGGRRAPAPPPSTESTKGAQRHNANFGKIKNT